MYECHCMSVCEQRQTHHPFTNCELFLNFPSFFTFLPQKERSVGGLAKRFDSLHQYPLSNNGGYWGKLSKMKRNTISQAAFRVPILGGIGFSLILTLRLGGLLGEPCSLYGMQLSGGYLFILIFPFVVSSDF